MPHSLKDSVSIRLAKGRKSVERHRIINALGARGAAALVLGTALSIGGVAETLDNVHFLVQKDLDAVTVVKQKGDDSKIVAHLGGGFTGNTVFKLAQVMPDKLVSRELALFDREWVKMELDQVLSGNAPQEKRDVFFEEMARVNDAIRAEFFAKSMPYGELIHEKAVKYDVDPLLVAAVIEQESRFKSRARSHVGAKGLMQLMPRTGKWMGARNLYDPEQNVDAGVKYIKYLNKRFKGDVRKTLAAYNGGEGNVKRYGGIPPFRETRQYVKKVLKNYDERTRQLEQFQKEQQQLGGSVPEADGTLTLR
ncbi:MAG TPA: lytic transglycosylase domain-containing protein [Thermoanaerobaculia bacterium]|jgi:soluble lytic murein transglycosylase-like protein